MRDSQAIGALGATLQYVMASDIPSQHKALLIQTLTQALRDQETVHARQQAAQQAGTQWQAHETAQLQTFLQGRIAKGWQHADELVMHLASQLHRDPHEVRIKATELGFGVGVDYRLARAHGRFPDE